MSQRRCYHNLTAYVSEYTTNCTTESQVVAFGRKPVVPQAMRIQHTILDYCARSIALCQFFQR